MAHGLPRNKTARLILILLLVLSFLLMAWHFFGHPKKAGCVGLCQCCYCDSTDGGICWVNGQPSACIGCVGACNGCPNCNGQAGQGGCGHKVIWCRGSDCCGGGATPTPRPTPTPTPPPNCHGTWKVIQHPKVASWKYRPPYPLVVGQDYSTRGFDVYVDAQGGWAELRQKKPQKHCDNGSCSRWHWICRVLVLHHYDDPITRIRMTMDLAQSSRAWIEGELRARYPNAYFHEKLPWEMTVWRGSAMRVSGWLLKKYMADDPGWHEGLIKVDTRGTPLNPPQHIAVPYKVGVYLHDTEMAR